MSGVDAILGGHHYNNIFLKSIKSLDEKYLKKWFLRKDVLNPITIHLNEISMKEHYARLYGPTVLAHQQKLGCLIFTNTEFTSYNDFILAQALGLLEKLITTAD